MRFFIFTLIALNAANCYVAKEHLICQRAEGIFSEDGRYQLTGPKGDEGEAGLPGVAGPPGRADYRIINDTIDDKVDPVIHRLTKVIEQISGRLAQLESKIESGNASAVVVPEIEPTVNRQENCKLWIGDKCYWAVIFRTRKIKFPRAKKICAKHSAHLANIYSPEEYKRIQVYLRGLIPKTESAYVQVHLGMRVNPQNRTVSFRDGAPAFFLPWHMGYPHFRDSDTHVHLTVRGYEENPDQGIHDYDPNYKTNGALCEL